MSKELSVVIPAYNEEKRLPAVLDSMIEFMKKKKIGYEIIVVVDKGKDNTEGVVKDYAKKNKDIRCIINPKKSGKGFAIRKGVLATKGNLVLFADADLSTSIKELEYFLPKIKDFDVVIGSRAHPDSKVEKKMISRVILGFMGNMLIRLFLGLNMWDTQCGFKLFRGPVARDLFGRSRINGFGFDFEILFLAKKRKYTVHERPVKWVHCEDTKVTWQSHFQTLYELFSIRWNYMREKYGIKKSI